LLAIIVLLALRRDKPLPDWPSLLNINSLVAIFSAVVKVALLFPIAECISELKWVWFAKPQPVSDFDRFDSAIRGPWGALKLLFERPDNILTSLGASVTILSLAIDPFAPQLLQFRSCLTPVEVASATVARTSNYTVGSLQLAVVTPQVNRQMTAAIHSGLLDPPSNASALMSSYCQSGNCTFQHSNNSEYTSLTICSSLEDISQLISGHGSIGNQSYETWNYTLTLGLRLLGTSILATTDTVPLSQADDPGTPLLTLEALMATVNCSGAKYLSKDECLVKAWAIRASLSPCVQTYGKVSFSDSFFEEYVMSTTMLPFASTIRYYALAGDFSSLPDIDCSKRWQEMTIGWT